MKHIFILFIIFSTSLITFGQSFANCNSTSVRVGQITWGACNVGARTATDVGNFYSWQEAQKACPKGWSLPNNKDFDKACEKLVDRAINYDQGWAVKIFESKLSFAYKIESKISATTLNDCFWAEDEKDGIKTNSVYCLSDPTRINKISKDPKALVRCVKKLNL